MAGFVLGMSSDQRMRLDRMCIDILGCQWEGQELYSACLLYLFYKGLRFQQKSLSLFFSGLSDNFINFFGGGE